MNTKTDYILVPLKILLLARECCEWHIEDGDACGLIAREVIEEIDKAVESNPPPQ